SAIGGEIADDSMKIAKWTAVKAENPDAYRKVTVEVFSIDQIIRRICFPNAFIVDYREDYFDTEGAGTFVLKVRQKYDKSELTTIEDNK
ncbi:MAG: membrane-associated protease 1, partial [Oscillospiraceae bacterium]|nr:membrane-associated protease 1 [Oscillospiraceae bacterium]